VSGVMRDRCSEKAKKKGSAIFDKMFKTKKMQQKPANKQVRGIGALMEWQ
jgi:hypothetical protein